MRRERKERDRNIEGGDVMNFEDREKLENMGSQKDTVDNQRRKQGRNVIV